MTISDPYEPERFSREEIQRREKVAAEVAGSVTQELKADQVRELQQQIEIKAKSRGKESE